jgi:hypothetical protein
MRACRITLAAVVIVLSSALASAAAGDASIKITDVPPP